MKHIFFVEDDLSLINGLSFAIKKQGYELTIARTSVEAEQLWTNGNYDLVILDVTLPDGSGFDLCRKIRASSKVPIMFLTAADEETDIIMVLTLAAMTILYVYLLNWLCSFPGSMPCCGVVKTFNQEQAETELQSMVYRFSFSSKRLLKRDTA